MNDQKKFLHDIAGVLSVLKCQVDVLNRLVEDDSWSKSQEAKKRVDAVKGSIDKAVLLLNQQRRELVEE